MKRLLFALLVPLVLGANVQAGEGQTSDADIRNLHQKNFLGQRSYHQMPVTSQSHAENAGEVTGATPVKGYDKHQQLRLNFLGKRPYMAGPHTD